VSLALEAGARAVVCASTGNTSASAAAYAARAGLQAVVLIPRCAVARGKLAQAVHLGARVLEVEGSFDAALRVVRARAESGRVPRGALGGGKLAQAVPLGAGVLEVEGNFGAALRLVRAPAESERLPIRLGNSVSPHRLQGQKTGAFEVCDQLGGAPDMLALPV